MRTVIACLLACLSTLAYCETQPVRLANGDWAPYLSPDLPGNGPVSQLVREAFAEAGYSVSYEFLPWKRSYENARDGSHDGTLIWSYTADRAQHFLFSDPVITLRTLLYHRADEPFHWQSVEDLTGKRIGGVIGYSYALEQQEQQGLLVIDRIADAQANYHKLLAGRLDLVAEDERVAQGTLAELGLTRYPVLLSPRGVEQ